MFAPAIALLLVLGGGFGQSGGALIGERTEGIQRICIYEDPSQASASRNRGIGVPIGLGEPCPATNPGPRRPRVETIPSLATLAGQVVVAGERICTYNYLGVSYRRPVRPGQNCPLTPHFYD